MDWEWLWSVGARLWSWIRGSPQTVVTDGTGIVSNREIKDVKAKSFTMKTEGVSDPGGGPSEKAVGQGPQAQYTATGGGVILADKISNLETEGDVDLSTTIKSSQAK
ncbi:uncharacterized protein ABDE67_011294 [Symphorus nematophorus]